MEPLTLGGALAIGGLLTVGGMIYDPIQKKWFPDTNKTEAKFEALEPGDDGIIRVSPELAEQYKNSLLDDRNPGLTASEYANQKYREKIRGLQNFNWNSKEQVEARRLAAEERRREAERYRDTQAQRKLENDLLRLQMTDQRLQAERDADYKNAALLRGDENALYALQTQRAQGKDRHALAIAELMDRKDKSAWEQNMYQQQLEYDREDRKRDQSKFYALLGQALLSEGVKAFF